MKSSQVNILNAPAGASIIGPAIDVNQIVSASFQVVAVGGTDAGTITLQMSNDLTLGVPRDQFQPTHWSDIPSATTTVAGSAAPPIIIANMAYSYIRAIYARSAGNGALQVNANFISP